MLPSLLSQFGGGANMQNLSNLRNLAQSVASNSGSFGAAAGNNSAAAGNDDDIPDLVENFEDVSEK